MDYLFFEFFNGQINEDNTYKLIISLLEKLDLKKYVNCVTFYFNPPLNNCEASYEMTGKTLNINLFYYENTTNYLEKLTLICNIFHEITHVKQIKLINECEDLETKLYKVCFEFLCLQRIGKHTQALINRNYDFYHDFYPIERMANIEAYKLIKRIADYYNLDTNIDEQLSNLILYGFGEFISPTEIFLKGIHSNLLTKEDFFNPNRSIMIKNLEKIFPLEKRINLGLPINEEELSLIRRITF